ncbi:hypothetical protein V9T40_002458 [Parthenolecanium corni]|uniref:Uncharacterized protein n=1 Tax=Parthenolecanium corni TaxID=536013 RepID=A0AAN9TIX8_9HEMI
MWIVVLTIHPGSTQRFIALPSMKAAKSTMSAAINTVSGTLYEDFVQTWMPKNTTEATASVIMKIFVVVFGIMCVMLVYVVEKLGEIIEGAICGMICSIIFNSWLIISAQLARINRKWIIVGKEFSTNGCSGNATVVRPDKILTGLRQVGGSTYIAEDLNPIFTVSFMYYTLIGGIVGIVIGLLVSFLTGPTDLNTLNPEYIAPGVRNFLPRFKKKVEHNSRGDYKTVVQEEIKLKTTEGI